MKQKHLIILCVCCALFMSSAAYAKNYVIALSPMQSPETLHQ